MFKSVDGPTIEFYNPNNTGNTLNNDDEGENFVGNNVQQMIDDSFYDHFLRSLNDSMEKNDGKLYINYFDIKKENKDKNEIKIKKSEITKYRVNDQFKNVEKIRNSKRRSNSIFNIWFNIKK